MVRTVLGTAGAARQSRRRHAAKSRSLNDAFLSAAMMEMVRFGQHGRSFSRDRKCVDVNAARQKVNCSNGEESCRKRVHYLLQSAMTLEQEHKLKIILRD